MRSSFKRIYQSITRRRLRGCFRLANQIKAAHLSDICQIETEAARARAEVNGYWDGEIKKLYAKIEKLEQSLRI